MLLTAEVETPVAASAALNLNSCAIVKHAGTLAPYTPVVEELTEAARRDRPSVDAEGRELDQGIEGVAFRRLAPHSDHRGSLVPFLDTRDPFWIEPVVYAYEITIRSGRIKGWGMHEHQTDRYFVASGNVRVVLYDGRPDRSSYERFAQFFFTDATPGMLAIPPGVWHADQNWGETDARIVNFPTRPYDAASPDKLRLDPHSDVIPFDWVLRDG
jgi:dTDP-4-dehydrorhamnose 3,5-epimerase